MCERFTAILRLTESRNSLLAQCVGTAPQCGPASKGMCIGYELPWLNFGTVNAAAKFWGDRIVSYCFDEEDGRVRPILPHAVLGGLLHCIALLRGSTLCNEPYFLLSYSTEVRHKHFSKDNTPHNTCSFFVQHINAFSSQSGLSNIPIG